VRPGGHVAVVRDGEQAADLAELLTRCARAVARPETAPERRPDVDGGEPAQRELDEDLPVMRERKVVDDEERSRSAVNE
jgi:hypothetical protein